MLSITGDQDALVQAGAALYQRGQFEAAASCGRKALKSRPAHLGALNLLGVSLNALGKHSKASEIFAELTRRDPRNADHWMNLGTVLKARQLHDQALDAYAHAGRLGEGSADFYYNVGLVHLAMGNFEAARTVLKDAARLASHDAEICLQYAECCDETMRLDDALAALDGWQGKRGLTTDLLARLALLFMKLGDLRSADQAVELAARDPAPDAEALLSMVQVQERTNRLQEARAGLARLKADPRSGALDAHLEVVEARLAERDGQMQAAHDLYAAQLARSGNVHERRSEEHTSELQSQSNLVCRLLLEKKKNNTDLISGKRVPAPRCRSSHVNNPTPKIGRVHVLTQITFKYRIPSSAS